MDKHLDSLSLKEGFKHGTPMFPVSAYHNTLATIYTHWHPHTEIIHVVEGEFDLLIDCEVHRVKTGDIALVPCQAIHSGSTANDKPFTIDTIVMDIDFLQSHNIDSIEYKYIYFFKNDEVRFPVVLHKDNEIYHQAINLVNQMVTLLDVKSYGYELLVKSFSYHLLALYYMHYKDDVERTRRKQKQIEKVKAVLEYVDNYYQKPMTIKEVADYVHFSPSYFCRLFKRAVGQTFTEYLNYKRVEAASYFLHPHGSNRLLHDTGIVSLWCRCLWRRWY